MKKEDKERLAEELSRARDWKDAAIEQREKEKKEEKE